MSKTYGLSSQSSLNCNKELIFVKLTDSALRAIEECQRNQSKHGTSCNPSIQFRGNEGFLSFPTSGSTNNQQPVEQKFSFSISNIEGPSGAFECIQQSHSQMNILGALQYKMRIQAKDDVYDATRESMAKAAETQKNKCTREIKPNQTDIGRKIKIKSGQTQPSFNRTTPNSLPATVKNNARLPSAPSSSLYSSGTPSYKGPLNSHKNTSNHNDDDDEERGGVGTRMDHDSHLNSQSSASSLIQSLMSLPTNYDDHDSSSSNLNHNPNHLSNRGSGGSNLHHRNPDIMKRSIKERLIHLLALRPFKKPELYKRVIDEGIKERDKNVLMNVLKSISYMRDNAFILHRHIWNDVHEDWPFYTEQDRQTLKRRKPQNLTPPLSSDGGGSSSTSGQSPNSQHNGSPPPAVKRPSSSNSSLNNNAGNLINGERVTYMEPNSKKPRISHYRKDTGEIVTVSNHGSRGAMYEGSRSSIGTGSVNTNNNNNNSSRGSRVVDQDDYYGSNVTPNAQESEDSGMSLSYTVLATDVAKRITPTASTPPNTITNNNSSQATNLNSSASQNGNSSGATSTHSDTNGSRNISSSNSHGNSYNDNNADMEGFRESAAPRGAAKHFSDYPRITSVEQRRKYKTEFDNDYAEYRQLHAIMEKVSRRFAELEAELRNEEHNDKKYKEIQKQILKEYKENSSNSSFQDKKKRFQYLHQKLSHIKRLVSEFDSTITNGSSVGSNSCASQRTQANY